MPFKDISYLQLWWPSCSAEWNYEGNFGKGHYEENVCEIRILTSGSDVIFKYFLSIALAAILFGGAKPFGQFWQRSL